MKRSCWSTMKLSGASPTPAPKSGIPPEGDRLHRQRRRPLDFQHEAVVRRRSLRSQFQHCGDQCVDIAGVGAVIAAYQFLIAGVPENLEYYVEAGGVKSSTYKLSVVDLPGVKKIRVTYHSPSWLGLKDEVEDPGGDLRAVEGTKADVAITTDKPLASGVLMMDDGSKLTLRNGPDGLLTATVAILKDGQFHIAALEGGEDVRLSEDYFIEAQRDKPPEIKMTRPGRDFKASPPS